MWMLLLARCAWQQASGRDHHGPVPAHHAQDADALSSWLQGPFLRDRFEDTDALGRPLLLCSWAQFSPILQYIQGQPLDLPYSKQQLKDLQKLAQRWELSGLDHIVKHRLRQEVSVLMRRSPRRCIAGVGASCVGSSCLRRVC